MAVDASEQDLAMRLELARRNSQNQNGHGYDSPVMQEPAEDPIYEGLAATAPLTALLLTMPRSR